MTGLPCIFHSPFCFRQRGTDLQLVTALVDGAIPVACPRELIIIQQQQIVQFAAPSLSRPLVGNWFSHCHCDQRNKCEKFSRNHFAKLCYRQRVAIVHSFIACLYTKLLGRDRITSIRNQYVSTINAIHLALYIFGGPPKRLWRYRKEREANNTNVETVNRSM